MKLILKSGEVPWEPKFIPGYPEQYGEFQALGREHGSTQFEMRLTRVPPHGTSTRYHTHTREEEWFYVLRGRCHICLEGGWRELGPGDSVFKPVGRYHIFRNFTDAPCEILMLGSNVAGSEVIRIDEPPPPGP